MWELGLSFVPLLISFSCWHTADSVRCKFYPINKVWMCSKRTGVCFYNNERVAPNLETVAVRIKNRRIFSMNLIALRGSALPTGWNPNLTRSYSVSDEQERVQKKTFVNWINSYLSKVSTQWGKLFQSSKMPFIYLISHLLYIFSSFNVEKIVSIKVFEHPV